MAHATLRSDSPLSNDQIRRIAPSVFAEAPHESRSGRYAFIPSIDVLNGLRKNGFEVYEAGQTIVRNKSKQAFTKHLLRLRQAGAPTLRKVGDEFPEVILLNSHDGSSAFDLQAGVFRLVCLNGMVVGDTTDSVKVRHSGNVVDNVIEGSFRVVEELKHTAERVEQYSAIQLERPEQLVLANAALTARWAGNAPITPETALVTHRHADRGSDLWTTFNVIQENLTKGGQSGRTANNRRTTTRPVESITQNTNLNKALWQLADEFAKLKTS